tara:strand:+ start:7963 stop:8448 length:486 start_codon:yes stop_codon:yes gene_type:complete
MDFRLYILLFDMKNPMCIYYQKKYKTWVDKNNIKIGHTENWSQRIGGYENNYGGFSINNHKNYPFCDGCGEKLPEREKEHLHVKIYKTWKFNPIKEKEERVLKQEFRVFGNSITQKIKDNPNFQNISSTEYFLSKDLEKINNEMGFLISKKNTQIYSVTVE